MSPAETLARRLALLDARSGGLPPANAERYAEANWHYFVEDARFLLPAWLADDLVLAGGIHVTSGACGHYWLAAESETCPHCRLARMEETLIEQRKRIVALEAAAAEASAIIGDVTKNRLRKLQRAEAAE